jgi:hypothetical protein
MVLLLSPYLHKGTLRLRETATGSRASMVELGLKVNVFLISFLSIHWVFAIEREFVLKTMTASL